VIHSSPTLLASLSLYTTFPSTRTTNLSNGSVAPGNARNLKLRAGDVLQTLSRALALYVFVFPTPRSSMDGVFNEKVPVSAWSNAMIQFLLQVGVG